MNVEERKGFIERLKEIKYSELYYMLLYAREVYEKYSPGQSKEAKKLIKETYEVVLREVNFRTFGTYDI